jgi:hypothetical protein
MTNKSVVRGSVAVAAGAVLILTASASSRIAEAQSQARGAGLAGTWFVKSGAGLTAFYNYHQDGTVDGVRSHEFGGPPRPGMSRSIVRGVWRRMGHQFEHITFSYNYDGTTGDALAIVRLRHVFGFDAGFDRMSGMLFVTQWFCPTPISCPDPSSPEPDIQEFPGGAFTQTRMTLP